MDVRAIKVLYGEIRDSRACESVKEHDRARESTRKQESNLGRARERNKSALGDRGRREILARDKRGTGVI